MLRLLRKIYTDKSTISELYFKEDFLMFCLEDTVRKLKIPHKTAIPAGRYEVRMTLSSRFGIVLPELVDVPFYTGIRIHAGNKPEDTDGCIVVGKEHQQDYVTHSKIALGELLPIINEQLKLGKLYIDIMGGYGASERGNNFVVKQENNDVAPVV